MIRLNNYLYVAEQQSLDSYNGQRALAARLVKRMSGFYSWRQLGTRAPRKELFGLAESFSYEEFRFSNMGDWIISGVFLLNRAYMIPNSTFNW